MMCYYNNSKRIVDSYSKNVIREAKYGYQSLSKFIQNEIENHNKEKKEEQVKKCHCCKKSNKRILSIVLSTNRAQTRIYYRVYDKSAIIDQQTIIKASLDMNDLYDIGMIGIVENY